MQHVGPRVPECSMFNVLKCFFHSIEKQRCNIWMVTQGLVAVQLIRPSPSVLADGTQFKVNE